jgi:hypothetical protein
MRKLNRDGVLITVFLNMLIFIFITGCATTDIQSEKAAPPAKSKTVEEIGEPAISIYYDFKDVPVPKELEIKKEKSFVFQTSEYTTGVLSFSGNVESNSLISFFSNKMLEDGWHLLSTFKSPKNIMFFQKENRFCVITIVSKTFTTEVEILVTPSFQVSS